MSAWRLADWRCCRYRRARLGANSVCADLCWKSVFKGQDESGSFGTGSSARFGPVILLLPAGVIFVYTFVISLFEFRFMGSDFRWGFLVFDRFILTRISLMSFFHRSFLGSSGGALWISR